MSKMEMNTWLASAKNMSARIEIMSKVPKIGNETVLHRWRRMIDFAIENGYGK